MPPLIQKLYQTCKEVFYDSMPGTVPSPADIERVRSVLDSMNPIDVGLSPDMPCFRSTESQANPPVTYIHLDECDNFSMGIFCLPQNAVIPLHNHPGMTVFSKILSGSMHIKSYDWVDVHGGADETLTPSSSHYQPRKIQLAKVKTDTVYTAPCNTSILYPAEGGNMHRFTASTPSIVLDVLGPPYCELEGRHCTYYSSFPYASFSGGAKLFDGDTEGYEWLEEREKPEDFIVVGAKYKGPKFVEN
ncbi:hypothetical protein QJS10_CPB14g01377 [Acorus calamus]|uniref:cysteine dioxygenase n=1 Tax=Acorus calamus TaxID=4465 RepID=A0AAV9DDW8_ACOCL|nr:hypothetical protein QJS10_CPB14g01377 [Acorus calamus]